MIRCCLLALLLYLLLDLKISDSFHIPSCCTFSCEDADLKFLACLLPRYTVAAPVLQASPSVNNVPVYASALQAVRRKVFAELDELKYI